MLLIMNSSSEFILKHAISSSYLCVVHQSWSYSVLSCESLGIYRYSTVDSETKVSRFDISIGWHVLSLQYRLKGKWGVVEGTNLGYFEFVCISNFDHCKRGYFRLGEILWKCRPYCSHGGNFHDFKAIPPMNVIRLLFLYPPQTKFGGVYRNHPVCLSVCPSVRLFVCPSVCPE